MCVCVCAEAGLLVFIVSLAVGSLLLLVLVIGSLMCCIKKRRPVKRYRKKLFLSFSLCSITMYTEPCRQNILSIFNYSSCVYFFLYCRCLQSTSGQSNPLFRSSSTRDSPRLGSSHISQPIFVESSATQACKPLSSASARPQTRALKPSRGAPEVSFCPRVS